MMYVLTFGGDPITLEALSPDEAARAREALDDWWRHNHRLVRILAGARLMAPVTATTIRFVGSRAIFHDGPFVPEPEAVGGYIIIQVADLDQALAMACSWPAGGYVEVRPLHSPASPGAVGYPRQTMQQGQDV